jgi:23S rRNA maturation-related 3'-5' exoribonuclease YhaM
MGIASHICKKNSKKEAYHRNRVSNLNSLRNSTGNASQLQSNQSRTISTSDQRNIRDATHLELNQMRSTSSRNRAVDDPPPSYAEISK